MESIQNEGVNPNKEDRDILRKQLKLLAEKSTNCPIEVLPMITEQMVSIYSVLH